MMWYPESSEGQDNQTEQSLNQSTLRENAENRFALTLDKAMFDTLVLQRRLCSLISLHLHRDLYPRMLTSLPVRN